MAYVLAMMVGLGSFGLYMSAFFFPEVHRKYDLVWSGVGLFYALVLWVCAGRITGGVLLGQMSSVALLGWFSWQNLQLRRDRTPPDQQTQLPDSVKTANDAVTVGRQTLKSLFNRKAQATPSTATVSATAPAGQTKSARPANVKKTAATTASETVSAERSERRKLKKSAQTPDQSMSSVESGLTPDPPVTPLEPQTNVTAPTPRPTPSTNGTSTPSTEPQGWDEGGEWETAELPVEDALGRFSPEVLNSLLEDTPSEPAASEADPIYLRAELLSEPKEPDSASRSGRRRGRRSRSTSARQLDIASPYSSEDDLADEAIAFGEASPPSTSRLRAEMRPPRRRRSPNTASDRDLFSFSSATYEEATSEEKPVGKSVTPPIPSADPDDKLTAAADNPDAAIAEELLAPGSLDTEPATGARSPDTDSDDWF
jgi:Ycf66 protein N-terminus